MADELNTLEVLARQEIDLQVATAKRYPRNMAEFVDKLREIALFNAAVAESCYYTLERTDTRTGKKKRIQGPSIRLLEMALSAYKNIRCGARIVADQDRRVVAQGVAHDLEANVFVTTEVVRSIVTREGRRYSDDMVGVVTMAALSIAKRNALLGVIPRQIIEEVMHAAMALVKDVIIASDEVGKRWANAVRWFGERGITETDLLRYLGRTVAQDVTVDDVTTLSGIRAAVRDESATLEEYFQPAAAEDAGPGGETKAERTARLLKEKRGPAAKPAEPAPPTEPPTAA